MLRHTRLLPYLLLLTLAGCGKQAQIKPKIPWNTTPAAYRFPRASSAPPVHSLEEVLTLQRCIKLQATDASFIVEVSSVAHLDGTWWVVDRRQQTVFSFDENGTYLGRLSREGQGPGEYVRPDAVYVDGNRLVLCDNGRGVLMFFDQQGRFLHEVSLSAAHIYSGGPFVFHRDKVYIADFSVDEDTLPNHLIMSTNERPWRVVCGFGRRFPLYFDSAGRRRKEFHKHRFTAFDRIGDHLWVGPPYKAHVEVYDLEGRYLADLPPGLEGLTYDDFQDITQDAQRLQIMLSKFGTHRIWHLDPYVLVLYIQARDSRISIFDTAGNMIQPNLKPHVFLHYGAASVVDGRLVTPLNLGDLTDKGLARFTEAERKILADSGFDPAHADNDNPYLLLSGRPD